MATTTNYGWTTPDDTALVKDGAAAIRTLGSSVDTTTKALNPSTTLGDIEYRSSTADTNTRLGIGSTGQVLTVAAGVPSWATPTSGGMTLISTTTLSSTSVTLSSIPATYNKLYVVLSGATWSTNLSNVQFLPNNLSTNYVIVNYNDNGTAESTGASNQPINTNRTALNTGGNNVYALEIDNYANTSYFKSFRFWGYQERSGSAPFAFQAAGGVRTTSAISSLVIKTSNNDTFSAGQVLLYGVK
jgi:hypothetical protein